MGIGDRPSQRTVDQKSRPVSEAELRRWYDGYVKACLEAGRFSNREDDYDAAKAEFRDRSFNGLLLRNWAPKEELRRPVGRPKNSAQKLGS